MRRTFNCGVGFVFVVARDTAAAAMRVLQSLGEAPIALGEVVRVPDDTEFEARVRWQSA